MSMFRNIMVCLLMHVGLAITPATIADTADLQVYKGEMRISVPEEIDRESMLIQYRSKTREVVRIGVGGLTLTNTATGKVTRLQDQTASLANQIDHEGFWVTDVLYKDLSLSNDNYRLEGRLTLYLHGSQRTRNFSVYLRPESGRKPPHSTIDWGISN